MNVYDFDETVFLGDTEDYFFRYLSKKKGFRSENLKYAFYNILISLHLMTRTAARQRQYRCLQRITDLDGLLEDFWNQHEKYLKTWYLKEKQETDIIASATPAFLLEPVMKRLGLTHLVATDMDKSTGRIHGEVTEGKYKLEAFSRRYAPEEMDRFFSDSYIDNAMATRAKRAYVVYDVDRIAKWGPYFEMHKKV